MTQSDSETIGAHSLPRQAESPTPSVLVLKDSPLPAQAERPTPLPHVLKDSPSPPQSIQAHPSATDDSPQRAVLMTGIIRLVLDDHLSVEDLDALYSVLSDSFESKTLRL
uniref:Uncharacterized protein n=1 Tax=Eutreptiella gymnastica TaxID=73025 RepID=A0A7S1NIH6_9EUGL|mmetsp:Transcript_35847/g.64039  ORF Transcript_35847/g.64039 Transcript_35847/m.64039 type:complete len:110 (+) Transcript_35847:37-366(+)